MDNADNKTGRIKPGLEISSNEYISTFHDFKKLSACSRSQKTYIFQK
jgi:hypothetical protein